jgi:prepilin-type N-terminal cleavage/methylation domain-containing protein
MKKGMTLMELTITIIIIGVLVMLSLRGIRPMKEISYDKEAYGTLKRLQEAERLYNMELPAGPTNPWYPWPSGTTDSNIGLINENLKVSLPNPATNWNYLLVARAAGTCVQATRNGDDARIYHLLINENVFTDADWRNNQTGACP